MDLLLNAYASESDSDPSQANDDIYADAKPNLPLKPAL